MIRKLLLIVFGLFFASGFALPLAGTYTVGGTAPNYSTLALAIAALQTNGMSAPVTFNVRNGVYNSDSFSLGSFSGSSATNTLTIQAESGNAADVTFDSTTFTFNLSASNIIVRNLSFSGATRKIFVNGASSSITNILIQDCVFTSTSGLSAALYQSDVNYRINSTQLDVAGGSLITVTNNVFNQCGAAIRKYGANSPTFTFSNNTINSAISPIVLSQTSGATITGNVFNGSIKTQMISASGLTGTTNVLRNRFTTTDEESTLSGSTLIGNYAATTHINFANNFFSGRSGIEIKGFNTANVNFNSFRTSNSHCLTITTSSGINAYNFYNNIFEYPVGKYALHSHIGASETIVHSDNNAFSDDTSVVYRYFTGESGNTIYDLESWRTFSNEDMNSVHAGVVFDGSADLHVPNREMLNNAGTPITGTTVDIDNNPRNATTPDIGADEFTVDAATIRDLGISVITPVSACDNSDISVQITNHSAFPISGFDIECAINNNRGYITQYNSTLAPGESIVLPMNQCVINGNTWYEKYVVAVSNPGGSLDQNFGNDSVIFEDLFRFGDFEISSESSDCNTNITLFVTEMQGATQLWSTGATGKEITVAGPGVYSVTVTDIGGCSIVKTININ